MYQDFFDKNDDYLNEFRQKVANQKIATVEERRSELARSRNNFLSIFAGITLAGVVGWFVLSPQYAQKNSEIPVIRRPQAAIKIKPENPGGMEIPNQDKDVYSIVEKKDVDNTIVENLLPTPEKPKLPDIVPEITDIEEAADETAQNADEVTDENAQNIDEIVNEVVETENEAKEQIKTAAEDKSAEIKQKASAADTATIPNKPEDLLSKTPEKSVAKPAEKAEISKPAEKAEVVKPETGGNWQIQLIASKNKAAVEKSWNDLSSRYPLLKSYSHEVQTSDLGAQGIFYRLRAGSFADKNAAAAACAALKKQGLNDCITKER